MTSQLDMNWIFGFNKSIKDSIHSLTNTKRSAIFYVVSQYGVIYDYETRKQIVLQGHCNNVTCSAVSIDKRWIATVDKGANSIIVVWDSRNGIPVKTLCITDYDIESIDFSKDSLFLVTLSKSSQKKAVSIWAWTQPDDGPILERNLESMDQTSVRFDHSSIHHLISCGSNSVTFWRWDSFSFDSFTVLASKIETICNFGQFTCSNYIGTNIAVTCTTEGYIICWEANQAISTNGSHMKATKIFRLNDSGINVSTVIGNYLVIGCSDGGVRFYDFNFRLEAWFEDLCAGSIMSVSFSDVPRHIDSSKFNCPDFIVGTHDALVIGVNCNMFNEVLVENRRGVLLLQGMTGRINHITCHSMKPIIAVCCNNGSIQLWNYNLKLLLNVREISHFRSKEEKSASKLNIIENRNAIPVCIRFQVNEDLIAVGFTNGTVKLLDGTTLLDVSTYAPSGQEIVDILFSSDGSFMACYDKDSHVAVFKRMVDCNFEYIGKARAHQGMITGISFGYREKFQTLISVGCDGMVVEYDLLSSTVENGIIFTWPKEPAISLDIASYPTALCWCPKQQGDVEDRFITAANNYKMKEYNADSKHCRKTTLAPVQVGNIFKVAPVNQNGKVSLLAYATKSRVIGLCTYPLTGNPTKRLGINAHPSEVSDIAVSNDGQFLFSSGGNDLSVNMWRVSVDEQFSEIDATSDYIALLEDDINGKFYDDFIDYFYYCQIRAQGEDAIESRNIKGMVPLDQIPNLMRAIGYYPSEADIESMVNEIRYKDFLVSGNLHDVASLDEVAKLYVNYKPTVNFSADDVKSALSTINEWSKTRDGIDWENLRRLLTTLGEVISSSDLDILLNSLKGPDTIECRDDFKDSEEMTIEKLIGLLV